MSGLPDAVPGLVALSAPKTVPGSRASSTGSNPLLPTTSVQLVLFDVAAFHDKPEVLIGPFKHCDIL